MKSNHRPSLWMRYRDHRAYSQAIDRAALMVLAALVDHIQPQFSSVQLEILRRRCDDGREQNFVNSPLVFADIRERCASILAAEFREACVADDVALTLVVAGGSDRGSLAVSPAD